MKHSKKIKITRIYLARMGIAVFILAFALIGVSLPSTIHAASGDAYFSLSPSSGSYTVGNDLVLSVSETSNSSDNTNATQVNLSYPSSLLQYQSISLDGPFTLCGQETGGSGAVNIGCASTTAVSGTNAIAKITFSVLTNGTAPIAMTSGSDIDNTSGDSVWNGVLPSASFTLSQPATTEPSSSGGTSTTPSSGSPGGIKKSSGSSSGSGSSNSTTSTTAPETTTPTTSSLNSVSVTVVNSQGKPIGGVKVTLDSTQSATTNSYGVANFSGVPGGTYSVTVSQNGKKSSQTLVLTSGENKLLDIKLDAGTTRFNYTVLVLVAIIAIILVLAGSIFQKLNRRRLGTPLPVTAATDNPVIMSPDNDNAIQSPTLAPQPPAVASPQPPNAANTSGYQQEETIIHPTGSNLPQ